MFPPKFLNFWYGVNTKLTQKNSVIWLAGQKLFAYAIFGIGIIFSVCGILKIDNKPDPFPIVILLICLWTFSRHVVHKILEKNYLSK